MGAVFHVQILSKIIAESGLHDHATSVFRRHVGQRIRRQVGVYLNNAVYVVRYPVMTRGVRIMVFISMALLVLATVAVAFLFSQSSTGPIWFGSTTIEIGGSPPVADRTKPTATERLRKSFGISPTVLLDESTIREHMLRTLPLGTQEPAVRDSLSKIGIGSGHLNHYAPPGKEGAAVVRISHDPNSPFNFVHTEYRIVLRFDTELRLTEIEPKIQITGL